ncbi:MAG: AMP-binding protein [Pseudomonadota bacterium]
MPDIHAPDGSVVQMAESPCALLKAAADLSGDHPALVMGNITLSYGRFDQAVDALAQQFYDAGANGRTIAMLLPNSIELCIALFAAQRCGAMSCTLNPDYSARELKPILEDADPVLILVTQASAAAVSHHAKQSIMGGDTNAWLSALQGQSAYAGPLPNPGAIASLQYTGGTTGRAKGVMLTHASIAANIAQREAFLPTAPEGEVIVCIMPLFHVFAVAMCLHLAVRARSTLVLLPRYRPDWLLETIAMHKVTLFPAGPTVFQSLLQYDGLDQKKLKTVTAAFSGSAPLSAATLRAWEAATGVPIYEGYGQTEAGPVLTYHSPHFPTKQGSVGPSLPLTEVEIVDLETGDTALGSGKVGEIRARGPQIMQGYRNLREETDSTLRHGWLYTGDIGRLDDAGYLFIEDRKKDLVISGGYNIYPREIDEALLSHPGVIEAAAIGVPDSYRGEVIEAFVVLKNGIGIDDIDAHSAETLVKYKRPARFFIVTELPKTTVGKIDKKSLKAARLEEMNHVA